MKSWTRREFGLGMAAGGLSLAPRRASSQTKPRVIVIGGGVGGATVARYLALSGEALEISLIEPKTHYTTCFFSNLYLAGLRSFESLTHDYKTLAEQYGINIIHQMATSIDPAGKTVTTGPGIKLPYDRLVVSPGIAFDFTAIDGYDEAAAEIMPHAWTAGPQTKLLQRQLQHMEEGGVFVITAPKDPFRCPPGPYERASLTAYYFKQFNPRAKILILDSKDSFFEQDLFEDAWNRHYPGMIEWLPAQFTGGIEAVDIENITVKTSSEIFDAAVANIIPPQKSGALAQRAGLADETGWCPIDPLTFESKLQSGIHVIGDSASAGEMPKSAYAANSQAKVCASAIVAAFSGRKASPPHFFNTCYTYLSANDAVCDAISFKPSGNAIKIDEISITPVGETAENRRLGVKDASVWYDAFTRDIFG